MNAMSETPLTHPSQGTSACTPGAADIVSHILSWVLSPILTPTYGIMAVFALSPLRYASFSVMATVTAVVFALTAAIPGLAVWLLNRYGDVSDLALSHRDDRLYPYIIMGAALTAAGFYLQSIGAPQWLPRFYWGAAIACAINLTVNFRWKISAHAAGMGGLTALFVILTRYCLPHTGMTGWIIASILLCGLLGSARVWLGRHTALQTITGLLTGFLSVFILEIIA